MKPYEVLNESIKFATKQLEAFKASKDLSDLSTMVIAALYRKIIELSEGVRVSGSNGLAGPAELNYRGLIEAYLALKYILQDETLLENRAKAYKIGYHKQQVEAAEYAKSKVSDPNYTMFYDQAISHHREQMEVAELQEILNEYDELQRRDRRGFIPKWYSLFGGPKSINQLVQSFIDDDDTEKEIMSKLYSFLSTGAHNYMVLNSIFKEGEEISIKPVRAHFNCNKDEYNFVGTRSLLTSSITRFTKIKYPEYTQKLGEFFYRIKPYLKID